MATTATDFLLLATTLASTSFLLTSATKSLSKELPRLTSPSDIFLAFASNSTEVGFSRKDRNSSNSSSLFVLVCFLLALTTATVLFFSALSSSVAKGRESLSLTAKVLTLLLVVVGVSRKERKLSNSSSPMADTDAGLIMEGLMLYWWELSSGRRYCEL